MGQRGGELLAAVGVSPLKPSICVLLGSGNNNYHFFLSHYQATGGDQVDTLCHELENMGFVR